MTRILIIMTMLFTLLISGCGTQKPAKKKKSILDRKVEMIEQDNAGKELKQLVKICALKKEHGKKVRPYVMEKISALKSALPAKPLPSFKESPNKEISVPGNVLRLHLKNNYPSGEMLLFIEKGGSMLKQFIFDFNTEKKIDLKPGSYEFHLIINRKFNDNKYHFATTIDSSGGELLLGEFNIASKYNKSGQCPEGQILDDDVCMNIHFDILDNCPSGSHLVEHLCCPEGYNFIMDGNCSRYSDKVETPVCPAGTHPAGKGRCCPEGTKLINDTCKKPEEAEKE